MTEQEWDIVQEVHVKSAYACSKAVWPLFRKQQSGKIINVRRFLPSLSVHSSFPSTLSSPPPPHSPFLPVQITSAAGIYGAFGQANYSAAKMGMISFSKTLAREGQKHNIHVNAVAPIAASAMTETIMPPEVLANLSPDMIVPLVAFLVSSSCDISGKVLEAGAGWYGLLRWERTKGVVFKTDGSFTPEAVKEKWNEINDFDDADHPENITDADYLVRLIPLSFFHPLSSSPSPLRAGLPRESQVAPAQPSVLFSRSFRRQDGPHHWRWCRSRSLACCRLRQGWCERRRQRHEQGERREGRR